MGRSSFVYVTYIRTTQQKLWAALTTDSELMKQYWFGMHCVSEWTKGARWKIVDGGGAVADDGEIVEVDPPRKLVIRWRHLSQPEIKAEGDSRCEIELAAVGTAVRLSITHTIEREPSKFIEAVSDGWPKIVSNLKSLLEGGKLAIEGAYPDDGPRHT